MKVFIIAALVLVAQCQLQAVQQPAHQANEGQRDDAQKAHTLPRLPEEMARMDLRQYDYYTTAKAEVEKEGRREDTRQAAFIAVVRNEAYEQLLPQGQKDQLKDPRNNAFLVDFLLGQLSENRVNLEDPKLITSEGLIIKNFRDKEIKIHKDARSGVFTCNEVQCERKEIPGNDRVILMILQDFFTEDKEGITRLQQDQGRAEERKPGDAAVIAQPGQERGRGAEGQVGGQQHGQRN